MSEPTAYTHAQWRVTPGKEDEFVEAWRGLADVFSKLDSPPLWGTLLRSETEPTVFYSFGPWERGDDVAAMRADPDSQKALAHLSSLCESATPGPHTMVAHIDLRDS